ncbi:MAG: DEAD/DEAH box helicase [Succinivibrio sp.]|nr:DEAD/DEAH box helicase [Succinivibrio sp.]
MQGADEDLEAVPAVTFDDLQLSAPVLRAVHALGFEAPTPIQERAIPVMLRGDDLIGQAQTGTGKTAAFALPLLSLLDTENRDIQCLILEPTRELALQVSEALQGFARYLENFRVAPIYGGASYQNQIRSLRHGAQVVVGTPGRLIDLIEQGKLDLEQVRYLVIDEADEMLHMGFIDDVDWILGHTSEERQSALFSATMPPAITGIARAHLKNPVEVHIESKTTTATTVHQRYWVASGAHKIDAMTRILEVEDYDAVLVFVRTKTDAEEVANRLMARGLACDALHGDIPQRQREKIISRLKSGALDIIIATDVAARGLDVDRITHVFNYDIPYDAESYVHRIGRTGRAGRTGEAILFVSPRERKALRMIERITGQRIEPMGMPSAADVNRVRLENFRREVLETIEQGNLEQYEEVISDLLAQDSLEPELLAAALAKMCRRDGDLFMDESAPEPKARSFDDKEGSSRDRPRRESKSKAPTAEPQQLRDFPEINMQRFRVAVGHRDGVKPGQIVGAIANEGDIDSKYIGEIDIFDTFSTVDLPEGIPPETRRVLAAARVCGRALELREYTREPPKKENYKHTREDRYRGYEERRESYSERRHERRPLVRFGGRDNPRRSGSRVERGFTSAHARKRDVFR